MKRCPFCAEEVQPAAVKCKHCGSMLDGSAPSAAPVSAAAAPAKEETLLDQPPVLITTTRAVLGQRTYAIAHISMATCTRLEGGGKGSDYVLAINAGLGAAVMAFFVVMSGSMVSQIEGLRGLGLGSAAAVVALGGLAAWFALRKGKPTRYVVTLDTTSGRVAGLEVPDQAHAVAVVEAITKAITKGK